MPNVDRKTLLQFSPFDTMKADFLDKVCEHAEVRDVAQGTLLFRRGKPSPTRFYLLDGKVELTSAGFKKESVEAATPRARLTLDDSSPTRTSAMATSAVKVLCVEADFLDLALAWNESAKSEATSLQPAPADWSVDAGGIEIEEVATDWMSALLASPLLQKIPSANLQSLFARFDAVDVAAGETVIKEGGTGDYFYLIDRGRVAVTNVAGGINATLEAGHFFGEEALVTDAPRNATVTMLSDGRLMRLSKKDFCELLHAPAQKYAGDSELSGNNRNVVFVDVRMPLEYKVQHLPGSRNFPLASLRDRLTDLDPAVKYVITASAGRRSKLAAYLMTQRGFDAYLMPGTD